MDPTITFTVVLRVFVAASSQAPAITQLLQPAFASTIQECIVRPPDMWDFPDQTNLVTSLNISLSRDDIQRAISRPHCGRPHCCCRAIPWEVPSMLVVRLRVSLRVMLRNMASDKRCYHQIRRTILFEVPHDLIQYPRSTNLFVHSTQVDLYATRDELVPFARPPVSAPRAPPDDNNGQVDAADPTALEPQSLSAEP